MTSGVVQMAVDLCTARGTRDSCESRWCLSKGLECRPPPFSSCARRALAGSGLQMTLSAKKFAASLPPNARDADREMLRAAASRESFREAYVGAA